MVNGALLIDQSRIMNDKGVNDVAPVKVNRLAWVVGIGVITLLVIGLAAIVLNARNLAR